MFCSTFYEQRISNQQTDIYMQPLYHTFFSCERDHVTTFKSITQFTFPAVIHQPISPHPRRSLTELWALWWVGVGTLEIYLSCCVQMVRCVWSAVLWFWGKHMAETVEQEFTWAESCRWWIRQIRHALRTFWQQERRVFMRVRCLALGVLHIGWGHNVTAPAV